MSNIENWLSTFSFLLPEVKARMSELACSYGDFRGGGAVGLKGPDQFIWSITFEVNEQFPSRSGDQIRYSGYAGLKLNTGLFQEADTKNTPDAEGLSEAKHEGAVIRVFDNLFLAVAYSGLQASQDKEIADTIMQEFFVRSE